MTQEPRLYRLKSVFGGTPLVETLGSQTRSRETFSLLSVHQKRFMERWLSTLPETSLFLFFLGDERIVLNLPRNNMSDGTTVALHVIQRQSREREHRSV